MAEHLLTDYLLTERLYELMTQETDAGNIAGMSLLLRRDGNDVCFLKAGFADLENQVPIGRSTIYRMYSMTKPVTGAAVMYLLENGILDLYDPVSQYLPAFGQQTVMTDSGPVPAKREIEIRDLLSMSAGLSYPATGTEAERAAGAVFRRIEERIGTAEELSTREVADAIAGCPLAFHPGEDFRYSTCADILGAVTEVVTGQSFREFLIEKFFEPLGMHDTDFWVPPASRSRLAKVYRPVSPGKLTLYEGNHLGIKNTMDAIPAFQSGGAGLASTLDDYARFAQMLLNFGELDGARVLEPETVRYFTSCLLPENLLPGFLTNFSRLHGFSYGNLLRVCCDLQSPGMLKRPGEYGWDGWLGMYFENFPDLNMTLLVGMQRTDSGTMPVTRKLRNVILSHL